MSQKRRVTALRVNTLFFLLWDLLSTRKLFTYNPHGRCPYKAD